MSQNEAHREELNEVGGEAQPVQASEPARTKGEQKGYLRTRIVRNAA